MRSTKRTWSSCTSIPSSISTTSNGRSGPISASIRRRSSCSNEDGRRGMAVNSMVSGGCIISGAQVNQSLLFSNVRVEERSYIERSVIFPDVRVGAGLRHQARHHRYRRRRAAGHADRRQSRRRCAALLYEREGRRARDARHAGASAPRMGRGGACANDRPHPETIRGADRMHHFLAARCVARGFWLCLPGCSAFAPKLEAPAAEHRAGIAMTSADIFNQQFRRAPARAEPERSRPAGQEASTTSCSSKATLRRGHVEHSRSSIPALGETDFDMTVRTNFVSSIGRLVSRLNGRTQGQLRVRRQGAYRHRHDQEDPVQRNGQRSDAAGSMQVSTASRVPASLVQSHVLPGSAGPRRNPAPCRCA